ncbi:MAG TPA: ATP-binding protein [Pyrinomonadaceae bacterium]
MTDENVTAPTAVAPVAPYPGLRPFETDDAVHFFGRDHQVDELLDLLGRTGFLAVVGGAGCGKSSLIRAGLLPALHGGMFRDARPRWRVASLRPGYDPVGALARALAAQDGFGPAQWDDGLRTVVVETTLRRGSLGLVEVVREAGTPRDENLLVVVDQFDDLFRLAPEGHGSIGGAAGFVQLLLEAVRQNEFPVYVALTLRTDYMGDCASFTGLPEAINAGHYLVPRLTRDQGREAVTAPAAVRRATVSLPLVDRVLNDLGNEPDKLPAFQHALMRTWHVWESDHEEGEPLDLRHYEEAGTVAGALAKHGEEAYAELPDERSRELAHNLFAALTELCAGGREIRRPVKLIDLCARTGGGEAEVTDLVEFFRREGRSFLSPPAPQPLTGESPVEISYENLIHDWPRLKGWAGAPPRE